MMTRPYGVPAVATILMFAGLGSCRSLPGDRAGTEREIREMECAWAQVAVTGDPTVMEQILADDFLGVSPDGVQYTKREFIEDTRANPLGFTSNDLDGMKVRFFGNVAVAQGSETFARKSGELGRFVWTDVLEHRDGRWQIVAAQDAMTDASTSPPGAAIFTGSKPSLDAMREIEKTRSAYASAWQSANASAIADLYTEEAFVLYPNQPAVSGRSAILEYFRGFFREFPRNEFELSSAEVVVTGDWAFDRGSYRWSGTPREGGGPEQDSGKYLVILHRQADGTWKVARDMDNSDRSASQPTRGTR